MDKLDSITYDNRSGGTLVVRYERPEWIVTDSDSGTLRFPSVPAWMTHVRETYGWPLLTIKTTPARCSQHPAYDADYCPACGTMIPIGQR